MKPRPRRILALTAAAIAATTMLVFAVLHLPPVRARVLGFAIGQLESRAGLVLSADRLSYNLFAGSASLTNVRLAARGAESTPILTAARVAVDLPLAAYLGSLILDDVIVEEGHIAIQTSADGRLNLPAAGDAAPADEPAGPPLALSIRGLHLRDVDVVYDDRTGPVRIAATGIDAALEQRAIRVFDEGATGPFAVGGGVDLQFGERALRVEPFESSLAFDGSTLSLQDLPLATAMGTLAVSGRLTDVLGALGVELTFDGQVRLEDAASLLELPVPVAGTTVVKGSINGPASEVETAVRFDAAALTVGAERDLQVSGEVLVDAARVSVNRLIVSPAGGGQVNAAVEVPLDEGPLTAEATWEKLDARALFRLADVEPQPIGTRLDGRLRYTAGPRMSLALDASLEAIHERGVTPLGGTIGAGVQGGRWSLTERLASDGVSAEGTAGGPFDAARPERSAIDGSIRVLVSSLAALDRSLAPLDVRVPEALRDASGNIDSRIALGGTFGAPRATVETTAPALDLPGIGPTSVAATVDADANRVRVSPLRLTRGSAEVAGTVTIDLAGRTLGGEVRAAAPDLRELQATTPEDARVAGSMEAHATLGGTLDAPLVEATISSPSLEFAGDVYTMLDGRLRFADSVLSVPSLSLRKDEGRVGVTGRYGLDGTYAVELDVSDLAWARVLTGSAETTAKVNGHFSGEGSVERPMGDGRFQFAIAGGTAGDLIGDGTIDVQLTGDQGRVRVIVPALGAFASGTVALAAPYDYRGTAVANEVTLDTLGELAGVLPGRLSGRLSLTAAVFGSAGGDQPPHADLNLQELTAQIAGVPLTLVRPATVTWEPGDITIGDLSATFGSGTVSAAGTWAEREDTVVGGTFRGELSEVMTAVTAFGIEPGITATGQISAEAYATANRGDLITSVVLENGEIEAADGVTLRNLSVDAGLTGEAFTLRALSGHLDAVQASGDFTATGAAMVPDMNPRRADGRFVIGAATFDAAGVDVKQTRPSTFSVNDGVLSLDDVVWEAAGSTLTVGGQVDASGETPTLDLSLTGVAALRVLSAFLPEIAIDGKADLDVKIAGTFGEPILSGGVTLDTVELVVPSPRFIVSDLSGPIVLSGNRIELRGLRGTANDGTLVIDGGIDLDGVSLAGGKLTVQASGVALEYPQGLRSEIDALLTYEISDDAPLLSGDVRIQRSAFTEAVSLAALARSGTTTTVQTGTEASALDDLRLNITVTTVTDMRVDNNYGRFDGAAQLRIVGTVAEPGLSGRINLREGGTISAAGRTFTITRGTISFTNLNRIEPDLDIQAVTRLASQGDVTLTLSGTPDRFEFDLSSEEGGTQEEIATALFGGGVTGANAVTLLSSDLLGVTGQHLGLDALRIDRGDVVRDEFREDPSALSQDDQNPVTRLTLSKRLREDVEFTVSQNLAQSGKTTFVVSYYPIPNLELRAISRDDASVGVGVRHQITLGGASASRTAAERPAVRVVSIKFEGDLAPLSEAELRDALEIKADGRFDYYRWQRDLEELSRQYVSRGYVEARVRGSRTERADGSVGLTYVVARGPATRIVVEGASIPGSEIDAIRALWSRAVFDRFVIEDAETRVRRHLVAAGFIEGTVKASMQEEEGADIKTLRIDVAPGPPSDRRTIRFTGNTAVGDRELESVVLQAGLQVRGWIERPALQQALTAHYRNEGYFGATVRVNEPELDGREAVLPVVIEEGERATIAGVQWSGVSDARLETMRAAANLDEGAVYRLGAIDAARTRVERRYRTLGYNSVRVVSAAKPDESGTSVEVDLTVTEGPQQVLQNVVTSGTTRTREGVVDRALRLKVGEPVNLEEWSLARKRLFDTNVFRTVDIQAVPIGEPVDGVQPVRASVTVEEYPVWRLRYGFQVDREPEDLVTEQRIRYAPGVLGELRNQNLFGRALTGGVAGLVERDYRRVNTFLQTPDFFGLPVRSGLFVYGSRENLRLDGEVFAVTDVRGVSYEQRWRRRRGFEITYGYRFETNHTYDPDPFPSDPFPLDATAKLGRLTSAFLLDRRDDPVSATRGTFTSVSLQQATRLLGSDARYGRLLAQQHGFFTVGPVVLASRAIAGAGYGRDELLPVDRFFAGGATTVRGYGENALGPRDLLFGAPLGGSTLFILNQEVRLPLYRWARMVGFVDAGNAFDDTYPFAWKEMKVGYGAGLRISSPIGLLRLDFGLPASSLSGSIFEPAPSRRGRWYFGLGNVF